MENLLALFMLILLQAVLGIDNLLYISLESKNAPLEKQAFVRKIGILLAVFLRIALLFLLVKAVQYFQEPIFGFNITGIIQGEFNIHSLIILLGGGFILYTSMKEIWHMISLEEHNKAITKKSRPVSRVIFTIVIVNLVFSFDSILGAMALSDVFWVMAVAIVIGGLLMIWMADRVSKFLEKNRMYEVLGLFILFLVGIMLISDGGHMAHLILFNSEITSMSKATFYFIIALLILIDIVQSRYQKNLIKSKKDMSVLKN